VSPSRYQKFRHWYRVRRPASILLDDKSRLHVTAEMAISIVILIPCGDPGDKRTVAFGASENSRPIGYLRSPVSVEMRD